MSGDRKAIAPQIIDEASEWFVSMRDLDASAESRAAFADWLRASPVHVSAYLEIARLWGDTSHIGAEVDVALGSDPAPNVVPIKAGADHSGRRAGQGTSAAKGSSASKDSSAPKAFIDPNASSDPTRAKRAGLIALAASVLLAVIGGGAWLYLHRAPTYVTDIGEQRTITLEDGSIVKLNSRSELVVRLSKARRQIDLVAGQALFEVAHDTARPFIVTSGSSTIRAVGTQFDVNRKHSGTIVTVLEGRVVLDTASGEPAQTLTGTAESSAENATAGAAAAPEREVYLSAGEQMRIAATGAMKRSGKPNTAAAISWLQQELIFDGQPLTDVLEEFNRYTRTPIVLADPTLGDMRINAVFHTTNPDSLLRFISRYDNVQIERSDSEVRISRK